MEAYWDCRGGISGHMTLAALCHMGLDVVPLQHMLCAAGVQCRLTVHAACSGAGSEVISGASVASLSPGHGCWVELMGIDETLAQSLCAPAALRSVLHNMALSDAVRAQALAVLAALLDAESHAQHMLPDNVRLPEAEVADMLLEMVGVPWGLEVLGIERFVASPLPWCSGSVVAAHGALPLFLPRPSTARLLEGKPIFPCPHEGELVTVLGAALVHALADDFQPGPQGCLVRVGTGYAAQASAEGALRLWLLEARSNAGAAAKSHETQALHREMVSMLESHVDHLSGEELGLALQELAALPEVLDVLWLPGIGKKNRPAGSLRVLCMPCHVAVVERAFFAHTHSLGIRCQHMERAILPREACTVDMEATGATGAEVGVSLRAKRYTVDGANYVRVECDALRAAAAELGGVPLALARGELRRG